MKNFVLAACLVLLVGCGSAGTSGNSSRGELQSAPAGRPIVLDVRTPQEYASGHVVGSTNVPVDEVRQRISEVIPDRNARIIVHCQSGWRSASATKELRAMGYTHVTDVGTLSRAREFVEGSQGAAYSP